MSEKFKFENLQREIVDGRGFVRELDYHAMGNGKFYQIAPSDYDVAEHITGWKFHISVAPKVVGRAWDLLQEKFEKQRLAAKVASPELVERFGKADEPQRGKMITIYEDNYHQRDMEGFLKDIERTLRENNIEPSYDVEDDRKMSGSQYINYRNDRALDGQYIDARETGGYNPAGHDDPFQNLDLTNVERSPYEKLNTLQGAIRSRYNANVEFVQNGGPGTNKAENARAFFNNEVQAEEMTRVLNHYGIPAQQATKGDQHLVIVDAQSFATIDEGRLQQAEKLTSALAMQGAMANHHSEHIRGTQWQAHTGTEATPNPHLRAYFGDADYAQKMAAHVSHQTGVEAVYATKVVNGQTQHMVLMPMDNPEHVQRNSMIMRQDQAQQQARQMQAQQQEVTQVPMSMER